MLSSRLLAASAGLFLLSCPAFAQNNVTLENLAWRSPDGKSAVTLPRVEVLDTNLSRDDLAKLFSNDTPAADSAAIASRMTASKLTIAGATIDNPDPKMKLGNITVTGIDKGRFATAVLDGFNGQFDGGSLTGRALRLEGGDLGPLFSSVQTQNPAANAFQVSRVTFDGFEGEFTDPQAKVKTPDAGKIKIRMAGLTAATDFKDGLPLKSSFAANGIVVEPSVSSEFGMRLKAFGYDRIELGLNGGGHYDPAAKKLTVDEYTIAGPQAGRLTISGEMTGVDGKALAAKDPGERSMALLGAGVSRLSFAYVNEGLAEKAYAFVAAAQGKTAAALRSETSAMAVQLLPLLLGGDPQSLELAQSVQAFLNAPKNFNLTLKARGEAVPLAQLGAIRDPKTFLALVNVTLLANQ